MVDYIRKSVMDTIPDSLYKQDDEEDEEGEDKQFESSDPIDWIDDNIEDVWEEEDRITVEIQSEGGETEERSLDSVRGSVYEMFDEETAEEICDEIEDMAD